MDNLTPTLLFPIVLVAVTLAAGGVLAVLRARKPTPDPAGPPTPTPESHGHVLSREDQGASASQMTNDDLPDVSQQILKELREIKGFLERAEHGLSGDELLPWTALVKYLGDPEKERTELEKLETALNDGLSLTKLLLFNSCGLLTVARILLHLRDELRGQRE